MKHRVAIIPLALARIERGLTNRAPASLILILALVACGGGVSPSPAALSAPAATAAAAASAAVLPTAPPTWCRYAASLVALIPGSAGVSALESAETGDFARWRVLGPDVARRGRVLRDALGDLEADAVLGAGARDERLLEIAWVTAVERSILPDARRADATAVFDTWDIWQNSANSLHYLALKTYTPTCP